MSGLTGRLLGCFLEPAPDDEPSVPAPAVTSWVATAAVVGGSAQSVVPVAGAVAGELRVRAGAPAAAVALWHPSAPPAVPAGAATPGARRAQARLAADGAAGVSACGRLAWLALSTAPDDAARAVRGMVDRSGVPVVLALCGPRAAPLEAVLHGCDLAVVVLPADADPDLRTLALSALGSPVRAVAAPLPAGPPRWAALVGLGRLRSLPPLPAGRTAA